MIIGFAFVPKFFEKFGKQRVLIVGMIISAVSGLLLYIDPRSIPLTVVTGVIGSLTFAPVSLVQFIFVADLTDYILKLHNVQIAPVVAMTSSVGIKVGTGIGAAVVGWGLQFIKFNPLETVQSSFTENGIIFLAVAFPAICKLIMAVLMGMWDLDKKNAQLSAE